MDKKNTFIGVLFIAGALALFLVNTPSPEQVEQQQQQQVQAQAAREQASTQAAAQAAQQVPAAAQIPEGADKALFVPAGNGAVATHVLENDHMKIVFTTQGGAIEYVELKNFPESVGTTQPPVKFNKGAQVSALALGKGRKLLGMGFSVSPAYILANFKVESADDTRVVFSHTLDNGLKITRSYEISPKGDEREPYLIGHKTSFKNDGEQVFPADILWLNLGLMPPTDSDSTGDLQSVGYFDGENDEFTSGKVFTDSKGFIFGIGAHEAKPYVLSNAPIKWGAVRNQFFAAIVTVKGQARAQALFARGQVLDNEAIPGAVLAPAPQDNAQQIVIGETAHNVAPAGDLKKGVTGALAFPYTELAPGKTSELEVSYYVGPKEYVRLDRLGDSQDKVMGFGFFTGFISKAMLLFLVGVHSVLDSLFASTWSWGWAIIIVTLIIKTLMWPLTAVQTRSAKNMSKISAPMKELREKYKDNPQRMQQEMMKLYKEHKVNPLAGCLPLFIQLPIFIGLFFMLRSASELRYQPFLWITDLSMPDTVGHIAGFPVHVLALLMGVTMFLQMRLSPTPMSDPMQRRIFMFMPLFITAVCYNFPSGLTLYWTVQNCFTIFQQWVTNRSKDPVPVQSEKKTLAAPRVAPVKVKSKKR